MKPAAKKKTEAQKILERIKKINTGARLVSSKAEEEALIRKIRRTRMNLWREKLPLRP